MTCDQRHPATGDHRTWWRCSEPRGHQGPHVKRSAFGGRVVGTWEAYAPAQLPLAIDVRPPARPAPTPAETPPAEPQEFPAALMETAARAKAWRDFLTQARFSLLAWDLDPEVRAGCQDVREWLRGCRVEVGA